MKLLTGLSFVLSPNTRGVHQRGAADAEPDVLCDIVLHVLLEFGAVFAQPERVPEQPLVLVDEGSMSHVYIHSQRQRHRQRQRQRHYRHQPHVSHAHALIVCYISPRSFGVIFQCDTLNISALVCLQKPALHVHAVELVAHRLAQLVEVFNVLHALLVGHVASAEAELLHDPVLVVEHAHGLDVVGPRAEVARSPRRYDSDARAMRALARLELAAGRRPRMDSHTARAEIERTVAHAHDAPESADAHDGADILARSTASDTVCHYTHSDVEAHAAVDDAHKADMHVDGVESVEGVLVEGLLRAADQCERAVDTQSQQAGERRAPKEIKYLRHQPHLHRAQVAR